VKLTLLVACIVIYFQGAKDAHMFAGSTIRRALDMKAPFLQCIKYFHTISCAHLQSKVQAIEVIVQETSPIKRTPY